MENRKRIIITVFMGLTPLALCILYCAAYGKSLGDIYIPNSFWNDELFYYKQVEAVLKSGVPRGYFGYNESHAQFLSFAAWNPLMMIPWVIWGFLFHWNFFSPFLCNLVCLMAGMAAFAYLARPTVKQLISLTVLLSLFTPFTRYVLSCMSENFFCVLLIWYMGLVFAYERCGEEKYLWQMYAVAGFASFMRPYFLMFLIYPVLRMKRPVGVKCLTAAGGAVFAIGYLWIERFLCAPYLYDFVEIAFIESYKNEGFAAAVRMFFQQLTEAAQTIKDLFEAAFDSGIFYGNTYVVYALLGSLLFIIAAVEFKRRKERFYFRLSASMAIAYAGMMAAVVFVYEILDGARHLIAFIIAGILIVGMYSAKAADKLLQIILAGVLTVLFLLRPGTPQDRQPPFYEEQLSVEIETMNEALKEKMVCTSEISWENTIIWLDYDIVGTEIVPANWQQLYAVPGEFGINFCTPAYVTENIDALKPKYIAVVPGGLVEEKLLEKGAVLLAGNDKMAVYRLDYLTEK